MKHPRLLRRLLLLAVVAGVLLALPDSGLAQEEMTPAAAPAGDESAPASSEPGLPSALSQWVRSRVPDSMLKQTFLLENWQWVGLLIVIFLGVLLDRLVVAVLNSWMRRLMKQEDQQKESQHQQEARVSFTRPVGLLVMGLVWLALVPLLNIYETAENALQFAGKFIAVVSGVWAAYRLVDVLAAYFERITQRTASRFDDMLVPLVRRSAKIMVTAVGIIFIADNIGVEIWGLLAGLSIGGVAMALAAKDTVENLFGSITVLADRPFQIGDWVVIGDVEGSIEQIGFRSTRIRTFYNSQITMPNSKLTTAVVDNMGRRQYRRFKTMLAVEYNTPPVKIDAFCEAIRELIRLHPYTRKDYYLVYLNAFGASSLDVLLYAFLAVPDWGTELREKHRLYADVIRVANRLGVRFAFPTQTLHVETLPGLPFGNGAGNGDDDMRRDALQVDPERHANQPADVPAAVQWGRDVAREVFEQTWGNTPQAPVQFDQPDLAAPFVADDAPDKQPAGA